MMNTYASYRLLTGARGRRRRLGSILAVALVMVMLAAISTLLMTRTVLDQTALNERRRELAKAFYMAETGVSQVAHWVNFPGDYTPNPLLFRPDPLTGEFTLLQASLAGGDIEVPENMLASLDSEAGVNVGHVETLRLLAPDPADPIPNLFKIESTGQSPEGVERTVVYFANANPVPTIQIPAGLISFNTAASQGNAGLHWGEGWVKNSFVELISPNQLRDDLQNDPWVKWRTEGRFNFASPWKVYSGSGPFNKADVFSETADQPGLFPDLSGDFADVLYQNVPPGSLDWPDLASEYQAFKDIAISNGRYYTTDASGNIYHGSVQNSETRVDDFNDEFGITDRNNAPADFAFIDTIDGNPPASDGSNLATISVAGTSEGLKGVYYMNANLEFTGQGSPPALNEAEKPDGTTEPISAVFLDGVLYSAGYIDFGGNRTIYGSVIAENGFQGNGTPDIYYNWRLANGMPFPFSSNITLTLWRNF